jgi:hypothetical protein
VIAARQRLKPRRRRRLRDVRWSVQWWAALTSVLAGLMSIPALIISVNALSLGEQQRADALKQRAEDQKERNEAKAANELQAKAAFADRVIRWDNITMPFTPETLRNDTLRNGNAQQVVVAILVKTASGTDRSLVFVPPCSQITLEDPADPSREETSDFFVANPLDNGNLWSIESSSPRVQGTLGDFMTAGGMTLLTPEGTQTIAPCF